MSMRSPGGSAVRRHRPSAAAVAFPRCRDAAGHIERGIVGAMQAGALTRDLGGRTSTTDFTKAVIKAIEGR